MDSRLGAPRFATARWQMVAWVVGIATLITVSAGFMACQAFGGHPGGEAAAVVPDSGGPLCLGACLPDPGWGFVSPADCNAARTLDKLPIVGFDDVNNLGLGIALDTYTYTDGTVKPLLFEYSTGAGLAFTSDGWQPETRRADFCGANAATPVSSNPAMATPGDFALHLLGGFVPSDDDGGACGGPLSIMPAPFRGYGGGIGISMAKLNNRDPNNRDNSNRNYCGPQPSGGPPPHPEVCPPLDAEYAVVIAALDASTYDGVSFWARRGPNGQIGIHIAVGDKYTDDDLSYLTYRNDPTAPRHCERVRQCSCSNHTECTYVGGSGPCEYANGCDSNVPGVQSPYATAPPSTGPGGPGYFCLPFDKLSAGSVSLNGRGGTALCAPLGISVTDSNTVSQCNAAYPAFPNDAPDGGHIATPCGPGLGASAGLAGDRQFWGRPCTPYTWPSGQGGAYCFDPAHDPPPADSTQLCGDHWLATVDLSTDWQFFRVPFSDLRQQGFAKTSDQLDLHSVSVVRFTWDAGWIDYWINDVSFYRNPK